MGEILGYPCYTDFETNNSDTNELITYTIDIVVLLNNIRYLLISNGSKNIDKKNQFNMIAKNAKTVLSKPEYSILLNDARVSDVIVEIFTNIPKNILINKLIINEKIDKNSAEMAEIYNILYNIGFSMSLQLYFHLNFQFENAVHRGILLSLLLNSKHRIIEPFCPLQLYPEQNKQVTIITDEWEFELINIISKTRI